MRGVSRVREAIGIWPTSSTSTSGACVDGYAELAGVVIVEDAGVALRGVKPVGGFEPRLTGRLGIAGG